jgi:hypothetical protein
MYYEKSCRTRGVSFLSLTISQLFLETGFVSFYDDTTMSPLLKIFFQILISSPLSFIVP